MTSPRPAWSNSGHGQWRGGGGGHRPAGQHVAPPQHMSNGSVASSVMPSQGPRITIQALAVGENVSVFHRYSQDPNGYFMVQHASQGIIHPSIGKTDGWTDGVVTEAWNANNYKQ